MFPTFDTVILLDVAPRHEGGRAVPPGPRRRARGQSGRRGIYAGRLSRT
jgi:hypothetical protein